MTEQAGIQVCEVGRIRGVGENSVERSADSLQESTYRLTGERRRCRGRCPGSSSWPPTTHLDQFKGQSQLRIQSELSVSTALDERRLAIFDRYEVKRNSD